MKNILPWYLVVIVFCGCVSGDDEGITSQGTIHLIYDFTPLSGSTGSEVVIEGMHFSKVPEENTVKFNNAQAEVIDATHQKLRVTVPVDATTGKISVTVNNITTVSTEDFIVK